MDALQLEVVETVEKLAAARRLRNAQLEKLKSAVRNGQDARELKWQVEQGGEAIRKLHQQRKQLWNEFRRSRILESRELKAPT